MDSEAFTERRRRAAVLIAIAVIVIAAAGLAYLNSDLTAKPKSPVVMPHRLRQPIG